MSMRARLAAWWAARRPTPLHAQLAVTFDAHAVEVRVLADLDATWNQTFRWADVARVCMTDGGLIASDLVRVVVQSSGQIVTVPLEAAGGQAFFGALCDRGLLPDAVWRAAMGETDGGTHCWPPDPPTVDVRGTAGSAGAGNPEQST